MTQVAIYNKKGEKKGELELKDDVFALTAKEALVHQVFEAQMANQREPWADTKDRGEVRGGGRKPWKQKGTGRARHGSRRSPIWVGGGVTFGPLSVRNYKQKINKKMKQKAVSMCLSSKVAQNKFIVLDDFQIAGKTKEMTEILKNLPGFGKTMLILSASADKSLLNAVNNIKKVDVEQAVNVNVMELLRHQFVLITKEGVDILEKRLS